MRAYNFCSGPATLPETVLLQAQAELLEWQGQGASVMEISHRSPAFDRLAAEAEQDLRDLLAIPANYQVLFLSGGASQQFAMVPMNLLEPRPQADYLNSGIWSEKAIAEAQRFGDITDIAALTVEDGQYRLTEPGGWALNGLASYLHYTPNETISGVEYGFIPPAGQVPLVADMSSTLLSRPLDVSRFGLIYAGAQKNIGPSGLTLVIVREDLLERSLAFTPNIGRYQIHAEHASRYNTPPTFAWYLAGLVFKWLKAQGGLTAMAERNARKAHKLYAAIDASDFYSNPVHGSCRSWMNVTFRLADAGLEKRFLSEAEQAGLLALAGHRSVGGLRASLYNAMPEAGVDALIEFMREFERGV